MALAGNKQRKENWTFRHQGNQPGLDPLVLGSLISQEQDSDECPFSAIYLMVSLLFPFLMMPHMVSVSSVLYWVLGTL